MLKTFGRTIPNGAVTAAKLVARSHATIRRTPRPVLVNACDVVDSNCGVTGKWGYSAPIDCAITASGDYAQSGVASLTANTDSPVSLKIVPAAGVSAFSRVNYIYAAAKDVSTAKFVAVDIHVEAGSGSTGYANLTGLYLRVKSALNNYYDFRLLGVSALNRSGDFRAVLPLSSYSTVGSGGAPDWAAIETEEFYGTVTASSRPVIHIDRIQFLAGREAAKTAIYVPTFDDGRQYQESMIALLNGYGLVGTLFVQTDNIGGATKLTLAQLIRMRDNGHLIANHWTVHDGYAAANTATRLAGYLKAVDYLEANGFVEGSRIFRPPGGDRTNEDYDEMTKYIQLWMMTNAPGGAAAPDTSYRFSLYPSPIEAFNSVYDDATKANALLTSVKASTGCEVTGWHDTDGTGGQETWANFKTHIGNVGADVWAGNVECRVVSEIGMAA